MYLASIKTYTHIPDSLLVGFSNPKTFHLYTLPPTPVILREAEGEVAESTALNEPSPSGRGGTVEDGGRGQALVNPPIIRHAGLLLPKGEGFPLHLKCGFCNSGQALRAK